MFGDSSSHFIILTFLLPSNNFGIPGLLGTPALETKENLIDMLKV